MRAGVVAVALALGGAILATPALAVGDGNSGGTDTPTCQAGYHWDKKQDKCVKEDALLDDKDLYEHGRDLAVAGEYKRALALLERVKTRDSMTLTMIGYAKRKSGAFEEGMDFYRQALALNPDNLYTREYLGEAYAEKGELVLAEAELARIEALCGGTECEHYRDLAKAIAGESEWKPFEN